METKWFKMLLVCIVQISALYPAHSIPFRLLGKLIVIQGKINGRQAYFLLDTGSSELLLNKKYFEGEDIDSDIIGIQGRSEKTQITDINLEIGQHNWEDLSAVLISFNLLEELRGIQITGLLGCKVFQDYELTIDAGGF